MTTLTARLGVVRTLRLPPGAARRALLAGGAWGVTMGLGLPVLGFLGCGQICLSDIAFTTAIAIPTGILTIGALAALGRRPAAPVR
jgi:hypothetical protein